MHRKSLSYTALISPEVQVQCSLPRMERLASRENIINRRIQQSSVPVAPETSTNSTMSERPQLLQDQDQQESSKQKVLQKAAKMKKLKKLGLANG